MEVSTCISIATSLICVLVATISWKVLNWVWLKPKRLEKILRDQGFRGNPYRILYGDSKEMSKMVNETISKPMQDFSNDFLSRLHPFFVHTMNKYGEKCFIWNGPELVVYILEPKLIKEVLTKMHQIQKLKTNPFHKVIGTGLVLLEGEQWAKHRKLLNPAFHMAKLKLMIPAFSKSCSEMMNKWEDMASRDNADGSCEVDVWSYFHQLSADAISRAALSSSYEEGKRIFELISQQLVVAAPILSSFYIPGWRFLPTKANRKIMEIQREIESLLTDIIIMRQKAIKAGENLKDDLLSILLFESSLLDDMIVKQHKQSKGLSLEEVIDECKIFYLTGQLTTTILLVWTIILLSKHQDWQKRARDEVLQTFGRNTPYFDGLNQLKIVNMILQEVLRLYAPATEVRRTVCKDIKVGDIVLPAGVQLNLSILHVQHNEKYWGDDAKEFKPERFSEGISKAMGGNMCFLSFGWGPRSCIGSTFAMIEAKVALSMILQRFSFEISPSYAHAPTYIMQLHKPQFGAQIILNRLNI